MYYLLNQTDQIIAADESLLSLCGVTHIDDLSAKIILGDITFDTLSENEITINNDQTYTLSKTTLSSLLGELTLVTVGMAEVSESTMEISPQEEDDLLAEFALDDTEEAPIEERVEESTPLELDDDPISIMTEEKEEKKEEEAAELSLDEEISMDNLLLPEEEIETTPENTASVLIDIDTISREMGISHEDYNAFVDEYIDTALGLESDLQSEDASKRSNAINTLSHLGDMLHLPMIETIIKKLSTATEDTRKELTESFYTTLARLTTQEDPSQQKVAPKEEEAELELFDMGLDEVAPTEEVKPATTASEDGFGTISLEGIKPIHFDFQLEEAANDLSLPVELIEEFVNDFIDQAHIETKKMLEFYEKGDLDAIQKIGHLLKGASSNLRINPLSDTLYQIQFCEDPSNLEGYIKDYWGHFLSFEIQINALAK